MKPLKKPQKCGKIIVKDGWVLCPVCGKARVLPVFEGTEGQNIPIHCKRCGADRLIDISLMSLSH